MGILLILLSFPSEFSRISSPQVCTCFHELLDEVVFMALPRLQVSAAAWALNGLIPKLLLLPCLTSLAIPRNGKGSLLSAVISSYLAHKELDKFFPVGWNQTHLVGSQSPTWNSLIERAKTLIDSCVLILSYLKIIFSMKLGMLFLLPSFLFLLSPFLSSFLLACFLFLRLKYPHTRFHTTTFTVYFLLSQEP